MAIYKIRSFNRWAKKEGLDDQSLCAAVKEMSMGLYEADLGGGLLKKRIARKGGGKSGGYRTIVATNKGDRWFFVEGFAKNERDNIDRNELEALKESAAFLLPLDTKALEQAKRTGALTEVICHEK
jgi:hypothetical protein